MLVTVAAVALLPLGGGDADELAGDIGVNEPRPGLGTALLAGSASRVDVAGRLTSGPYRLSGSLAVGPAG